MFFKKLFWEKKCFGERKRRRNISPTEQMSILYLERLVFPLFVQMVKKSDALVVLLDKKQE